MMHKVEGTAIQGYNSVECFKIDPDIKSKVTSLGMKQQSSTGATPTL